MSSFHEYHSVCIVMIVAKIHGTLSVTSTLLRGCFVFTHGVFMTILGHPMIPISHTRKQRHREGEWPRPPSI